ncbi:MAG: AAA family ATPase [Candidatus Cloacimonadota bacterium]|nr:AAA family ATPase [Candidatus Cloacimonadota bacterium]
MATVLSMINLKGGVGKTQVSVGLAEFLVKQKNKKVLVIDLDPQTNATVMLIGDKKWKELNDEGKTLYQLFKDKIDTTELFDINESVIKKVSNINGGLHKLHLLPSSLDLINIQDRIPSISQDQFGVVTPSTILKSIILPFIEEEDYDYVIVDCPPNLGMITLNGLMISDYFIIPTKADYISTYGIPQILDRIDKFNTVSKKDVKPLGIAITLYSGHQRRLHDEVISMLEMDDLYPIVFESNIPYRQKIAETSYYDGSSYTLKQKYGDAFDILNELTNEILEEIDEE